MVGCGTSLHAGMVGDFAFEELAALQAEVQPAAEFRYRNPLVDGRDLVVAISQSGETADTLAAVREAYQGRLSFTQELMQVLSRPFIFQEMKEEFMQSPGATQVGYKTFCGT